MRASAFFYNMRPISACALGAATIKILLVCFMRKRLSSGKNSSPLFRGVLIVSEMIIAVMLKMDKRLRQSAFPLAQENLVICMKTYLPQLQFYITINQHGVLLDLKAPFNARLNAHGADLLLSGSAINFVRAFVGRDEEQLDKLTIRGSSHHENLIKDAIKASQEHTIARGVAENFKKLNWTDTAEEEFGAVKSQVVHQRETITELSLALREADYVIRRQARSYRRYLVILSLLCLIALSVFAWITL